MAGFGTSIIATDYNAIQSKINNILGTGSADYGYGQALASSQVARNNKITVVQWNNLRTDLLKARQHQTGNDEASLLVLPTTSTTIKEVDRAAYNTFADTTTSNRLTIPPASQGTLANFVPATRTSPWASTISHTVTVTFASSDAARFYFNSGGNFKFSASFTNYTNDTSFLVNRSWATLLTNMGIISMSANTTTNTGTGTPQNIGWYNLTTTNQLIFTKFVDAADSQYSPNQYDLYARRNAGSTQVIFTPTFSYTSPGSGGYAYEPANGTLTSISQQYYATGSNVSIVPPTAVVTMPGGGTPTPPPPTPPPPTPPPPTPPPPTPPPPTPPPPTPPPPTPPPPTPPPPTPPPPTPPPPTPPPPPSPSYSAYGFSPAGPVNGGAAVAFAATISNAIGSVYAIGVQDGNSNTLASASGVIATNPQTVQVSFNAVYVAPGLNSNGALSVNSIPGIPAVSLVVNP